MSNYLDDFTPGSVVRFTFTTVNSSGAPTQLAGSPAVSVYKDGSTTESTTGVTLTVDFDARTGLNLVTIDTSTDGTFYSGGSDFHVVITAGTVGGTSVNGYSIGQFSLNNRSHLRPTVAGRTLDVSAGGEAGLDWANIGSPTTAQNLSATNIDVDQVVASVSGSVGSVASGGITSASFAAGAIDNAAFNVTETLVANPAAGGITAASFAAGAINAAAIATGAIDADALAADAVTEIRSLASGTADSGSTTTMVDADRTEADADYWKGQIIVFTSGTLLGQARLITAFDPATDTITFSPATTVAVATHTYEIWPGGRVDVGLWGGNAVNALVSGRVDASVGAVATGVITSASFAANAIDAAALAADAVTEIQSGLATSAALSTVQADTDDIQARLPAALVGGRIDASVGAMAANVITASALAADAVDEIVDATYDEARSGHVIPGSFGEGVASVQGNVTGSVNSVVTGVTVTTNNDKAGYALSAAGVDAILDDPITEPSGVFAWGSATLRNVVGWLGAVGSNEVRQTSTTQTLRNRADTANIATAAVSDDGSTFTRDSFV
jgi:hypothetical protein